MRRDLGAIGATPRLLPTHGLQCSIDGVSQVGSPTVVARINFAGSRVEIHILTALIVNAVTMGIEKNIYYYLARRFDMCSNNVT